MHSRMLAAPAALVAALAGAAHTNAEQHTGTATKAKAAHAERVVGFGQIRFRGAGPEMWALRFRRERRVVYEMRKRLAARLDEYVGLVLAFECIHSREGSWGANTGNGYYGGLQFGAHEWSLYGGGYSPRADLATPAQQIAAGITYHAVSGFYPWPATARACGLIR